MIKYDLTCSSNQHVFESWFNSSVNCDKLLAQHAVDCPTCGDTKITKSLMAPNIATGRPSGGENQKNEFDTLKEWVDNNCADVGENFAHEARAMHYGDKEPRDITGSASYADTVDMIEEGIEVCSLGPVKDKMN